MSRGTTQRPRGAGRSCRAPANHIPGPQGSPRAGRWRARAAGRVAGPLRGSWRVLGRGHAELHKLADLAADKLVAEQMIESGVVRLETAGVVPERVEQHAGERLFPHAEVRVAGCVGADEHRVGLGAFRIIHVDQRSQSRSSAAARSASSVLPSTATEAMPARLNTSAM